MTRAAVRSVGVTLAALATVAALAACESRATPAQIRSEPRSQSMLSTGPPGPTATTGPAASGQTGPAARGTPSRPVDRRRGRRGRSHRRGGAR
jgi:hypothetical protein